jgi:flagellar basal-body rod modification protein FlgD
MFLKLMVAQLRNQDPMNPTDSSQFLSQTAQFTSLEKMTELADQTSQALSAQLAFGASSLVGKTVTYTGTDGLTHTGAVGSVRFTGSGPVLGIDGTDVSLASVTSTTTAAPITGTSGTTGTGATGGSAGSTTP